MEPDAALMHDAFMTVWERLYAAAGGRLERRADLIALSCARLPVPQANGAWVQTHPGHERTRRVAAELGLTHAEHVPAMVIRPGELAPCESTLEIDVIAEDDVERTVAILASAFEAPRDLFDWFGRLIWSLEGASWYVGRAGGRRRVATSCQDARAEHARPSALPVVSAPDCSRTSRWPSLRGPTRRERTVRAARGYRRRGTAPTSGA